MSIAIVTKNTDRPLPTHISKQLPVQSATVGRFLHMMQLNPLAAIQISHRSRYFQNAVIGSGGEAKLIMAERNRSRVPQRSMGELETPEDATKTKSSTTIFVAKS